MTAHGIEATGELQAAFRCPALEVQSDIEARLRGRLNDGKLLFSADADIGPFRRQLNVAAEFLYRCTQLVVDRL